MPSPGKGSGRSRPRARREARVSYQGLKFSPRRVVGAEQKPAALPLLGFFFFVFETLACRQRAKGKGGGSLTDLEFAVQLTVLLVIPAICLESKC